MRNVQRSIDEYNRRFVFREEDHNEGAFFTSDADQLFRMSRDPASLVFNSLYFGFMVGMRYGIRKTKERYKR